MIRSSARVRLVTVMVVLVLVAALGASVASATVPPGVNTEGTGPSPKGAGLLSKAALAQETCTEGGRTNFYYAGNGPFCVNPWADGKDNGGATAPGVTATTVKVVGYFSNDEMLAQSGEQPPKNSVTGERVTWEKVVEDQDQAWNTLVEQLGTFQLWGRTPEIEVVIASGADETAQRADALAVLEKNPFMVFDLASPSEGGSAVFSSVVAQRKIITWSASTTPEIAAEQSPYRWSVGQDPNSIPTLTAAFLGRTLSGKKARWAGDEAMTKKTRVFGAVYPNSNFDFAGFEQLLKENGGSALADSAEYDPDPARSAEQAATFVTKLKSKGVTTVVLFATSTMVGPLMKAATDQEYQPEWILTGSGYHDYPLFPRTWDQDQAAHAFGTGVLSPNFSGPTPAGGMDVIKWYWGSAGGSGGGSIAGLYLALYQSVHYAGPTLTAANLEEGLFSAPAFGGAADGTTVWRNGFGKTVDMPYDENAWLGSDNALIWWNPEGTIAGLPGKGAIMFMNGGKRAGYGDFPKREPKFFEEGSLRDDIPIGTGFVGGVVPAVPPCNGCPSSGGVAS